MTDTTAAEDSNQASTLVWRDPTVLAAHPANLREGFDVTQLNALAKSIAARGVLEPLLIVPDADGGERIIAGHRRCAAAIQAQVTEVPCILRADLAGLADSVITMLVENTQRADLTAIEVARGHHQLALAGLSATKIAKSTGHRPVDVKRALAVTDSDVASEALATGNLTLEQAAALAELADDELAVAQLLQANKWGSGQFDHQLARIRADQAEAAACAARSEELAAAGAPVGTEEELPPGAARVRDLQDGEGHRLDADGHGTCPGHRIVVAADWEGQPVDVAYCAEPEANGHRNRHSGTPHDGQPTGRGPDGKLTEQAKAERRQVIDGNKAWRAARTVRQAYLVDLLARRTPPKGTLRLVAQVLTDRPYQ